MYAINRSIGDVIFFFFLILSILFYANSLLFKMSLETKSSVQWFLCQIVFTGLYPLQQSFYSQQVHVWGKKAIPL